MYDDNLTFVKEDKKEDFITTLGLGLEASYEGKRRTLSLSGDINQRFNAKYSDIKTSSESATLYIMNEFSDYDRVHVSDTFSHGRAPRSFEEEFGRVGGIQESFQNSLTVSYLKEISRDFMIMPSYAYSQNLFPEAGDETVSDSTAALKLSYLLSADTSLSTSYSHAGNNFGNSTQTINAGLNKYLTDRMYINANAGFNISSVSGGDESIRLTYNISFSNDINENTVTKVSFVRSDRFASDRGDIFNNWQLSGQLKREFLNRLTGSFQWYYGKNKYADLGITDTFTGLNTGFSYEIWKDFSSSVNYSLSNYDSEIGSRGYIRNEITASLYKVFE
ncbi:MAG: outer membrane beta-barrel protein [Nitrospirae bacterium]|nr:outer membrane beta-barrel protein [Nitrospirota bacterium]